MPGKPPPPKGPPPSKGGKGTPPSGAGKGGKKPPPPPPSSGAATPKRPPPPSSPPLGKKPPPPPPSAGGGSASGKRPPPPPPPSPGAKGKKPPPPPPSASGRPPKPSTPPPSAPSSRRGSASPGNEISDLELEGLRQFSPPQVVMDQSMLEELLSSKLDEVKQQMASLQTDVRLLQSQSQSPRRSVQNGDDGDLFNLTVPTGLLLEGDAGSHSTRPSVEAVIQGLFTKLDVNKIGKVNRAEFRAALLNDPQLLGAPSGQLINKPASGDVLNCERLVRLLDHPGGPFEVNWAFVSSAFNQPEPRTGTAFETTLKRIFSLLDTGATGKVKVPSLVKMVDETGLSDPLWDQIGNILRASPAKWEVSWSELSMLIRTAAAGSPPREAESPPREAASHVAGLNQTPKTPKAASSLSSGLGFGRLGLDATVNEMLAGLDTHRLSTRFMGSPVIGAGVMESPERPVTPPSQRVGLISTPNAGSREPVSPAAAKRQLRVDAVADRLAALRESASIGGDDRTQKNKTYSNRLSALEARLAKHTSATRDHASTLEDQVATFNQFIEDEGRAIQRSAKQLFSAMQQLKDGFRSGSVRKEIVEDVAPRVYRFLLQSAETLDMQLDSDRSPIRAAKDELENDKLAAQLRNKSEELDQLIHQHGLNEERLTHLIKGEIEVLMVGIEDERSKRKHMETVFVSLMESIITRLYQEMHETFTQRKAMDARLNARLSDAVALISGAVL